MRKLLLLIVIAGSGAMFGGGSASAQSLEGQWLNVGSAMQGAQYALHVFFAGNGALQYEMGIESPGGQGSGVTRCQGRYQFDGQNLQTEGSCMVCPASGIGCVQGPPLQFGGPVQFQDPYTLSISGDIFRRE
jgi:hypothetical protein